MIRGYQSAQTGKFVREIAEVTEFYVDDNNEAKSNTIYKKGMDGSVVKHNPTKYLLNYLSAQGVYIPPDAITKDELVEQGDNVDILFE